ncbi:telomeric repeat binding factor a isoform X2 [Acanthopagrus latus]|uniref:telomeric repeat binding factor a isoform X2 n=1 Tax=Acanthopagrus latus TaxID=8177 RepID=UPI00187CF1B8|nr:telomeric repeat binding factor a isoform X2 [Acanthopagrus latus]
MAANESVNSQPTDVETIVNRWLVDYYVSLALELFQKELYEDFRDIRAVIESVLDLPVEKTDDLHVKIQLLKFLSRINEGENLNAAFGPEKSTSPLESALSFLEAINRETSIPQQDFENVCTSLKEMIVVIFIKNNKFDEAKMVLNTHFPKQMIGKKAIFMGLIRKKSKTHEVIEQSNFQRFRNEILAFCRRLCPDHTPFLLKAAKMLKDKRLSGADEDAAGPDVQEEPGPSSSPQTVNIQVTLRNYVISPRTRLEAAYRDLAPELEERTFAQLEVEVEREEQARIEGISLCLSSAPTKDTSRDTEQDGLFQRASGSPMEASPADQPPQTDVVPETQAGSRSKIPSVQKNRQLSTLARLVVEPDSQQSTPASQELENEVGTEELQSPAVPSEKLLQSPLTDSEIAVPTRKRRRRSDRLRSGNSRQLSSDSEEDLQESPSSYRAPGKTPCKQLANDPLSKSFTSTPERISDRIGGAPPKTQASGKRNSTKSNQRSSNNEEDQQLPVAPCKTPVQKPRKQLASNPLSKSHTSTPERISDRIGGAPPKTQASGRSNSTESNQMPSDNEEDQQPPVAPCKTPVQKPRRDLANNPPSRESDNTDEVCITDSSLDSSPNPFPRQHRPRRSSTPQKDSAKGPSTSKWKTLFNNAKESKETWDEEDCLFISEKNSGSHNESNISNSGHRKRRWTESETQQLKEGVRKFGEGNWSKIKSYYTFENRTNINLKDRWRTLKKLKMV